MDITGAINIWTILEIGTGSIESDPGLAPGGRVKLVLAVLARPASPFGVATLMEFCYPDANDYLIGEGFRCIRRGKRFGQVPDPPAYYTPGRRPDLPMTIASSPFCPQLFIVGYASGSLRFDPDQLMDYTNASHSLFTLCASEPVVNWPDGCATSVVQCRWSCTHPSLVLVLDRSSRIQLWDVLFGKGDGEIIQLPPETLSFIVL